MKILHNMDTIALHIPVADEQQAEMLIAELAEFPFESFQTEEGLLSAYLPQERMAECRSDVDDVLARYGLAGRCETIGARNWNAPWESGFEPVDVEGRLLIRAPFHAAAPAGTPEVVLTPRMSFGTGHHATTWLMARAVLDRKIAGQRGLDMGCGTGVLSIVAAKCGAAHMDAVDIDDCSVQSSRENVATNGVADCVTIFSGDVRSIAGREYDFILANINRNVLIGDLPAYAAALHPGGDVLLSGFLEADVPLLLDAAAAQGLRHVATQSRDGWMLIIVRKG